MRKSTMLQSIVLLVMTLVVLLPLLTLFFNSLKTRIDIVANPFGIPTNGLHLSNYLNAWIKGNYSTTLLNSLVINVSTIVGTLLIAGLAAYAITRTGMKHGDVVISLLIFMTSLPIQIFLVPLFIIWTRLELVNTRIGLVIIYIAVQAPFATFLLRSYMVGIPLSFDESARIDGASDLQILRNILLPILWPSFLTVGLVTGLYAWNEFLLAVTFINRPEVKPVSTSLYAFTGRFSQDWALTSAASVMMIFPIVLLFIILQRKFIEGLTQGGLKG